MFLFYVKAQDCKKKYNTVSKKLEKIFIGIHFQEYCEYINEPKQLLNPIRDIIFFDNWILE